MTVLDGLRSAGFRAAGNLLSRGGEGRRLVILHYHRVPESPDPMCPDLLERQAFAVHMRALAEHFNVVPLAEAIARLRDGTLGPRAVAITFDDGYADNYQVALPVLRHFGLHATFFVAAGFLDGGCMFNDLVIEACRVAPPGAWDTGLAGAGTCHVTDGPGRVRLANQLIGRLKYLAGPDRLGAALQLLHAAGGRPPDHLMMTSDEVRSLHRAGMAIGGHTLSHPILARLVADEAAREISSGKAALENLLGAPVPLFAYPNGKPGTDYLSRDVALARGAGFDAAVTTVWASATRNGDAFEIPRVGSWDRSRDRFCARLLRCYRQLPATAA
ncbi:MAG: polysaccharide deacetylase family protein [Chromatiales bacterium]|nr:polysaccharide deacetylase family protein [Chromatiales bacterium]